MKKIYMLLTCLLYSIMVLAQTNIIDEIANIRANPTLDNPTQLKQIVALYSHKSANNDNIWNIDLNLSELYFVQGDKNNCLLYADKCFENIFKSSKKTDIIIGALGLQHFYTNNDQFEKAKKVIDTATFFIQQLKLTEKNQLQKDEQLALASYYYDVANRKGDMSQHKEAELLYLKAMALFKQPKDSASLAVTYHQLGYTYDNLKEHTNAIKYYLEAIILRKQIGYDFDNGYSLNNLATNYIAINEYDNATKYINEAIQLGETSNNYNILFNALRIKAQIVVHFNNFSEAETYLQRSLAYALKTSNTKYIAVVQGDLGLALYKQKKYTKALNIFNEALTNIRKVSANTNYVNYNTAVIHKHIGNTYKGLKQFTPALEYLKNASQKLLSLKEYSLAFETCKSISEVFKQQNNLSMALSYADTALIYKDSAQANDYRTTYKNIEEKYDNTSKQLTIEKLKIEQQQQDIEITKTRARNATYLIIASSLLGILGLIAVYSNKTRKQKKVVEQANIKLELANEELAEFNTTQTRLFSIISHDLKGMIIPFHRAGRILKSYIQKGDMDNTLTLTEKLEENALRLSTTLNNLLHWALHQMKGIHLKKENLMIYDVTEHVADHYKDIMKFKNIQFHNNLSHSDSLFADAEATNIIIRNLISNATKFTENGSITISGQRNNNTYTLVVKDTGAGMSQEVIDNLFTHTAEKIQSGTKGEKGSGLGILVIKKLLEIHDASIQVESTVGEGSTFTLSYNMV